ncbi:hypothetical protein BJ546DRAFT_18483 [Cryomyces antarcticus]
MRALQARSTVLTSLFVLGALPVGVLGVDILKTNGFSTCLDNATISVERMNVEYNKDTKQVTFDVAGSSSEIQNVTASMKVLAYGKQVYQKDFNPCDKDTFVAQLCPVPAGHFAAAGSQDIPSSYASMIPSIAFSVPDLDGEAKLELKSLDSGQDLACIQSTVNNGKTMEVPAVSYVAVGIAGAALALSALSALGAGAHAGSASPSPSFSEVVGWFQGLAMNGMLSVPYPSVYRSFTKNFAFSGGLVSWGSMQTTIDSFRQHTGGNLTNDSYKYLRNATLVYSNGANSSVAKRGLEDLILLARDITTNVNGTSSTIGASDSSGSGTPAADNKVMHYVHGIQSYVEELSIPQANTFMTVLVVFAVVIAAITAGILLFKVILETWALFASFPKRLTSFRKQYWWLLAKTITNLILLLYGVWTLYCVYQFTNGDSWAAKVLAAVTFALFTATLAAFTFKIWQLAHRSKRTDGDASILFEDKETWRKYSLFYDVYKKSYWWAFVPAIVYMFAKGCVIAGGNGHGLVQTAGQLIIESLMLILLLWWRPYTRKSGNWVNSVIQVVRVLSVVCILLFVEELGVSQSTKTITGVVLVVMQSVLTGVLAILIAVNAIVTCVRENPHRKQRKEAEKLSRDLDTLTPLDARNSLLMDASSFPTEYKSPHTPASPIPLSSIVKTGYQPVRSHSPAARPFYTREESQDHLISSAASIGGWTDRSYSPPRDRQPRLPDVGFGRAL